MVHPAGPPPIVFSPSLALVPLDQAIPGFTRFIGAWLYRGEKTVLIDPGPAATIPHLLDSLTALAAGEPDVILLTHIHMDHAGGIGEMAHRFRHAQIVCHEKAVEHLVDPGRLWEGSRKILGHTADAYGPIRPVGRERILSAADFHDPLISPIPTPGHSVHHVSYRIENILFAGEAGGVFLRPGGKEIYLRPATPPRFFLETSVRSIETLLDTPHRFLCYGHFGMTEQTPDTLSAHRDQLGRWAEVIDREKSENPEGALVDRCVERLLAEDRRLAGWGRMPRAVQNRERFFIGNSVRGFLEYLDRTR